MSQRNPMNDRYQTDEHKGQTRKSAASAKPKTKAASSVRTVASAKPPKQKKADQKIQRKQQRDIEAKYYNPPTAEYKKWRKLWWIMLIGAIITTGTSFLVRMLWPEHETISLIILGIGYIGIIGALFVDFAKIRKVRKAYQEEMQAKISKEERAVAKQARASELAAKKAAEEAAKNGEEAENMSEKPKKGLFSFAGLKGAALRASETNKSADRKANTSEDDAKSTDQRKRGNK